MKGERRRSAGSESDLDELTLEYLGKYGTTSVQRLHEVLKIRIPSLTESEVVDMVWRLSNEGKAQLDDVWPVMKSFTRFLGLWERHLSLYGSLMLAFAAILSIYVVPAALPWVSIRWVLASVFVLFIPGYATVEALFPTRSELNSLERFALSVGLSLAIIMLVGFLLNYTAWGIRLTFLMISLTIISLGLVLVSLVREYFQQDLTSFR
jgi:hypothetical protein